MIMRHRTAVNSLTFDEVQNHLPKLGKPLNAMNLDQLDELLSAVSTVDQASSSCSSIANNSVPLSSNYNHSDKKTTEVWHGIVQGNVERCVASLGETTLEEFLFRAGAIHLGSQDHIVMQQQQQQQQQHVDWWNYQEEHKQQISMLNSNVSEFVNTMVGNGCGVGDNHQMGMQGVALPMLKHTLSDPQIAVEAMHESIDKNFQRKQKRMIKNRESAARSRARKQAYITQLEEEVTKLTFENKRLKKQKEEDTKTRSYDIQKPKYQLRRTSTCHF
ncbi:putative transcription factor bZIP family [Dioscorea sansibarensis]